MINAVRTFVVLSGFFLLISAGVRSVAAETLDLNNWQYSKSISLPSILENDGYVKVSPDVEIYRHSANELEDIRIVQDGNQEGTPYVILIGNGETHVESAHVSIRDLSHSPNGNLSFQIDVDSSTTVHNQVEILINDDNFQWEAMVEGSGDGQTWSILNQGHMVFDITIEESDYTARSTTVPYTDSTVKYLKVSMSDLGQKSDVLDIVGANLFLIDETPPEYLTYDSRIVARDEQDDIKSSLIIVDVGDYGLPSSRLVMSTSEVNFFRAIKLEGSDDSQEWDLIPGDHHIHVYDTPQLIQEALVLDYRESVFRYLRLSLLNEDSAPLTVDSVEVSGFTREIIFPVAPESSYSLYYGNTEADKPVYDMGKVVELLDVDQYKIATLGSEVLNPTFQPPQAPYTERYPWILPAIVVIAVVVIGALLVRTLLQIRRSTPS